MSYASVAAHNAPPLEEQPRPDTALLNTTPPTQSFIVDDGSKVSLVPPDFKEQIEEMQSPAPETPDRKTPRKSYENGDYNSRKHEVKDEQPKASSFSELAQQYLIRPGVAGGILGIVNIGLLASVGRIFYTRPLLRRDPVAISSAIAAAVLFVSAEGFAAEKYRKTSRGQEAERRARREGPIIFRHLREQILRPGVLGGVVGLVNTAILGALGYISYQNWDRTWDKRTVSAISLGLLTLWSGEGFVADKYLGHNKAK